MIKIVIVDDDELICQSLQLILNRVKNFKVLGYYCTVHCTVEIKAHNPDIVLIDMEMDNVYNAGITLCNALNNKETLEVKKLILSTHDGNKELILEALDAGANGYLAKKSTRDELVKAIHDILSGDHTVLGKSVVETLVQQGPVKPTEIRPIDLTPRQKEIFTLVCLGKNTIQITDELCISPKTLEKHKADIRLRLNLEKDIDFLLYALQVGDKEVMENLGF